MQPHSISAMAIVKHIFAQNYAAKIPKTAEVQIDWKTPEGKSKSIFHYISGIEISRQDKNGYITEVRVSVRTTDGTPCTLTVRRQSDGEFKQGERLIATHSVQHVAGLEEQYEISRNSIRGLHRHSYKYRDYMCSSANENSFNLVCEVRVGSSDKFVKIPYNVKVKVSGEEMVKEILKREEQELLKAA